MKKLRYGMVGGDLSSFIGNVHRHANSIDPRVELVSGSFSLSPEKNVECGKMYSIAPDRLFTYWQDMVQAEAEREDGIDFVSICTPNHLHYEICKAFLEAGIHVVCEKPLCFKVEEAEELMALAKEKNRILAVMYTYTGYNMVKVMRDLIRRGDLGEIVAIHAVYAQDWLLDELTKEDAINEDIWRTDPQFTGIANSVGDIGTHLENIIHYLTGFRMKRLCSTVDRYGKKLDYNDNILVEYENGVHAGLWCSQVAAGKINGLRIEIFGTEGALEWEQHFPDYVKFTKRGEPSCTLTRGAAYLDVPSAEGTRIPSGHPEGFHIAFANIYRNIVSTLLALKENKEPTENDLDFPTVEDGLAGVKFVHAVIQSGENDSAWVTLN